ncbi:MAG: nitroreductase family protein [Candidatus Aegiribacteria sp.]|nr:nitroreductase family protein [Candidatus Aegiribacteria sp.]
MRFSPEWSFEQSECTGCGICEKACPSDAIVILNGYPFFTIDKCIACGHCGAYCPENCFGFDRVPDPEDICSSEKYLKLLEARRSIRHFSTITPSEEEINNILSVLSQSPTGVNKQGITVRVVRGAEAVEELLRPVKKLLRILDCTGISFLIGKLTGRSAYLRKLRHGRDIIFRGAPVVLYFHVPRSNITGRTDGIIAAATVMHHAVTLGYGTLWNGIAEKLYQLLPSWHSSDTKGTRLTAVLCIGYPEMAPEWKVPPRDYQIIHD